MADHPETVTTFAAEDSVLRAGGAFGATCPSTPTGRDGRVAIKRVQRPWIGWAGRDGALWIG